MTLSAGEGQGQQAAEHAEADFVGEVAGAADHAGGKGPSGIVGVATTWLIIESLKA